MVPDTPAKRREYEQQIVKTFFLSNADLKETIDLLRIVLGARRVAPLPGANALTISDAPDKVAAAERIIDVVDKERAEVAGRGRDPGGEPHAPQGVRDRDHLRASRASTACCGAHLPATRRKRFTLDDNPYSRRTS